MDVYLRYADHLVAFSFHSEAEVRVVESEEEVLVPESDGDLSASSDHVACAYGVIHLEGLCLVHVVKRVLVVFLEPFHIVA